MKHNAEFPSAQEKTGRRGKTPPHDKKLLSCGGVFPRRKFESSQQSVTNNQFEAAEQI
jgi:hypothetical protein